MRIEYCWKIDSYSNDYLCVLPPFTVFHYEIK